MAGHRRPIELGRKTREAKRATILDAEIQPLSGVNRRGVFGEEFRGVTTWPIVKLTAPPSSPLIIVIVGRAPTTDLATGCPGLVATGDTSWTSRDVATHSRTEEIRQKEGKREREKA